MTTIQLKGPKSSALSAIVDDDDFEFLSQFKWNITGKGHVGRTVRFFENGRRRKAVIWMHRVVMERAGYKIDGFQVDYINLNKVDNRKENLRIATNQLNQANRPPGRNNSSGIKGVNWNAWHQKWLARIGVSRKRIYLGMFSDIKEARLAYREAAVKHFGEFARS
jgi:hypothetical protein